MNRRSSIKNITILGVLGISSFSIVKWLDTKALITIDDIEQYKPLIAELSETILPRTDTPGAKDARVEEFIILMIRDCSSKKDQSNFLNGLASLEEYAIDNYHQEFQDCTITDKMSVLKHFESLSNNDQGVVMKIRRKFSGKPFFYLLKDLTVEGFCTSQLGATQALAYDYLPGTFQSCIHLQPRQRSWATK